MRPLSVGLVAASVLFAVTSADAQYRNGQPPVLAPSTADQTRTGAEGFVEAYTRAGSPMVAVLWNRALSDQLSTNLDVFGQSERSSISNGSASHEDATVRLGVREAAPEFERRFLTEDQDWALQSAYISRLNSAGMRLVDRNLAMRTTAASGPDSARSDRQTVETDALTHNADLLLEIQQTPDPSAAFGVRFRIQVKAMATGQILAVISGDGKTPAAGAGRFVAGSRGFERAKPQDPTIADAGAQLADDTMAALAAKFGQES